MRFYPRGLKRELLDEYLRSLAPDEALFREFKTRERAHHDHARAFAEVGYERRFVLSEEGLSELRRLAATSRERDVVLVCQCAVGVHCHRELLLLTARERLGAVVEPPTQVYPEFLARLATQGDLHAPVLKGTRSPRSAADRKRDLPPRRGR